MAAKPYLEGKTWSVRLRIKGQEVYRSGFATVTAARKEAERIKQQLVDGGPQEHKGPWRTTVAEALQNYSRERLPWLKGAVQESSRINRYLRACDLDEVKVCELPPSLIGSTNPDCQDEVLHWEVKFSPSDAPRLIPKGLHTHRRRQATRTAETDKLRQRLGTTPMANVTTYQIQQLIDAMARDGYKPATIGLERAMLRRLFSHAQSIWNWHEPRSNPAGKALKLPKIDNGRNRVLTNAEWKKVCIAMKKTRNPYLATVIGLLLHTAMRISEPLVNARWADVDWDSCVLHLRVGKAGRREVPLNPEAVEILKQVKQTQEEREEVSDRIFPTTYEAIKAAWRRACETAGIQGVRIHDLRHTAATRFALQMGSLPVLMVITGHKTVSQLSRYTNVSAKHVALLMHKKLLQHDDAPAGMQVDAPSTDAPEPSPATTKKEALPSNVIPLRRAA